MHPNRHAIAFGSLVFFGGVSSFNYCFIVLGLAKIQSL